VPLSPEEQDPLGALGRLPLPVQDQLSALVLRPTVTTRFQRIALVRRDGAERVTIDVDLHVSADGRSTAVPGAAFVEVKQAQRGDSPFVALLAARRLRSQSASKYCLGVALLFPHVKHHRFKPLLARLTRLAGDRPVLSLAS
jgi:hypothetical protein